MFTKNDYIAVFDSGVGGISVLRCLRRVLPEERFLYYGDAANAPYGTRTTDEVRALTLAAIDRVVAHYPVKAVVIACNTATAAAIGALREAYPDHIVIGIEPALKLAADSCPGGRIGVMATAVTLREEKLDRLVHRVGETCTVEKIPAPGLVELIEAGKGTGREAEELLRTILSPHIGQLDALVLGCTHYPFAAPLIEKIMGQGTRLLDGGDGTARETQRRLAQAGLLRSGEGELIIESSRPGPAFERLARQLMEA